MGDNYKICLVGGKPNETAIFTLQDAGRDCLLRCSYRNTSTETTASDFFEALCAIRLQFEKIRLIPFCYGASLNVFPSGMSRSMGQALKAYKLVIGHQAKMADLVEIFGTGPDVIPATVQVQQKFFQQWCESLYS